MVDLNLLSKFQHIFKLDPNRPITDNQLVELANSGTDAIIIGGTLDITYEDTVRLFRKLRKYPITLIQEISDLHAIVQGFDYYFIPLVLNSQDPEWILNPHQKAIKKFADLINWEQIIIEGYIVLNENSSVAKLTKSLTNLSNEDIIAYGTLCDKLLKLPILYIEYSGTYGDLELMNELKDEISYSKIFYGGGIKSRNDAQEMYTYADTVVVGNLIYEDFSAALDTVKIEKSPNKDTLNKC